MFGDEIELKYWNVMFLLASWLCCAIYSTRYAVNNGMVFRVIAVHRSRLTDAMFLHSLAQPLGAPQSSD